MLNFSKKDREKRFHIEEAGFGNSVSTYVLTDLETGVQYLYVWAGASGGLTPLLDEELKISRVNIPKE